MDVIARCGCGGTCSCLITAGEGVVVEGIGTVENPYEISSDASEMLGRLEFDDSSTIEFTQTGTGTVSSPMHVTAVARVAVTELTDVSGTPNNGQVLVWSDDHWEPQDQSGGSGVPPGGTDGQVLTKQSDTDGDAAWETPASGGGMVPSEPYYASSRRHSGGLTLSAGAVTGIPFDTEDYTDGIPWNGTAFVVPVSGYYHVNASVRISTAGAGQDPIARIRVNGSSAVAGMNVQGSVTSVGVTSTVVRTLKLNAGDVVDIAVSTTSANQLVTPQAYYTWVNITKVPSPGGVPTAERVYAARRNASTGQSIPNNTETAVALDTMVTEDGIAWNGTAFVIPVAGYYQINALVGFSANTAGVRQIKITQNGGSGNYLNSAATTASSGGVSWSRSLKCAAGDLIGVNVLQNSGATLTVNTGTVDIFKVPETIPATNGIIGERIYAASRATASGQSIPHNTSIKVALEIDTRSDGIGWDAVNNAFLIPVTGWYRLSGAFQFVANATGYRGAGIWVNGVNTVSTSDVPNGSVAGQSATVVKDLYLTAGDAVAFVVTQTSGVALALSTSGIYNFGSITKIPSVFPQSVAIGERTYASVRRQAAATSVPNATQTNVPWDTVDTDDGIPFDGTRWTVPVAGYYHVFATINFSPNPTGYRMIRIMVNGASNTFAVGVSSSSADGTVSVTKTLKLAAGDTISTNATQSSGATLTLNGGGQYNYASVTKVPAPAVAGSAASGVWGAAPLDRYGTDSLQGRPVYVDSNGQLRAEPAGVWVDCAAEVRFCTDSSSTANAGQSITSAKYMRIGKTVWFKGNGVIGTGAVTNFALLLPPSAGAPVTSPSQAGPAQSMIGSGESIAGGWLILTGDRIINRLGTSTAYSDSVANEQYIWSIVYEVV